MLSLKGKGECGGIPVFYEKDWLFFHPADFSEDRVHRVKAVVSAACAEKMLMKPQKPAK